MSARATARGVTQGFDRGFYIKLASVSFVVGAAFEGFMLATDFYPKILHIEAERRFNAEEREKAIARASLNERSSS
ncbi:unnamed product [Ostreococcus tauri]|jgi:hypothetical protein|uniref:Unnamed product n=1 Tax=Ostreococcus tauri TaxID=70448 RepID=Q00US0_OSTTA|nr:unnamed product [Ostreococcus tauri]OUS44981.1 hypothetical protein BE221DRAFT_82151 [Ostreococcus tauri]CAL57707.1 unnamed product [Ostreococcus tauri]|eukprot:XP_003083431.1 unnamed product [Ostreococcus tauri]